MPQVVNDRNERIKCTQFTPSVCSNETNPSVVIYLHGNAGCRIDGIHDCYDLVVRLGLILIVLDFAGSGLSEGEYVTLGYNEQK